MPSSIATRVMRRARFGNVLASEVIINPTDPAKRYTTKALMTSTPYSIADGTHTFITQITIPYDPSAPLFEVGDDIEVDGVGYKIKGETRRVAGAGMEGTWVIEISKGDGSFFNA